MLESDQRPRLDRTRPLAILNRLGNVDGGQHLGAGEIGDRPRDLKDAMELDCAAWPRSGARARFRTTPPAPGRTACHIRSTKMSMRSSKGPDIRRW